ncbi:MAG: TonB family protein [Pseudomonadota bacterium]
MRNSPSSLLLAAPLSAGMTLALLFVMHALLLQRIAVPIDGGLIPIPPVKIVEITPPPPRTTAFDPPPPPELLALPRTSLTVAALPDQPLARPRVQPIEGVAVDFGPGHGPASYPPAPLDNSAAILVRRTRALYPADAIRREMSGFATVRFDVTASGTVTNVTIVAASDSVFMKPALQAARKLKFRARHVDGQAVVSRGHELRYRFDFGAL